MELFQDRDRSAVQRLGLGVPALAAIQHRHIIQRRRDIAMVRTEGLLDIRQQPLRKRDRFGIFCRPD
jgi:hypothetical protein